jgi:hypothetical protein
MNTDLHEWLDVLRREYVSDFIRGGGAAVKFVVASASERGALRAGLQDLATSEDLIFAAVDAATTKTHMVEHVFHDIARQVDWDELAYLFVSRLAASNALKVPTDRNDFSLRSIAALNEQAELLLRNEVNRWLTKALFRDYQMSQEFRIAMIRLCMAQLDPEEKNSFLTNAVKDWLRGDLLRVSTVKDALIFQKVARHNARHMLFSLTHWLKLCGKGGLVIWLDVSRYTVPARTRDIDGLSYTTPAVMDGYEVLRQFIDGTDEMEGCLLVIGTAQEFLTDPRRGLACYDALRLRISDEVRDRARPNPLGSLIRLAGGTGESAVLEEVAHGHA